MKPQKPGIRHQRSLNVDFTLCGLRRAEGHLFSPNTARVTCPDCKAKQAAGRKTSAARLAITRPVFCKHHNKVHTVLQGAPECAPGAWNEAKGIRVSVDPNAP